MGKNRSGGGGDCYPTPSIYGSFAVQHALSYVETSRFSVESAQPLTLLEPGCGDTAPFISSIRLSDNYICTGLEVQPAGVFPGVTQVGTTSPEFQIHRGVDYLEDGPWMGEGKFDLIVTNPPFSLAEKFVRRSLDLLQPTGVALFLLRLAVVGSEQRMSLFEERPPAEIATFVRRISFDGKSTDYSEYALFIWLGSSMDFGYRSAKMGTRFTWIDNTSKQIKNNQCLRIFG